jgi:hypothetical protein
MPYRPAYLRASELEETTNQLRVVVSSKAPPSRSTRLSIIDVFAQRACDGRCHHRYQQGLRPGSFHLDATGDSLVLQDDGDRVDDPDARVGLAVHDDLVLEPHAARDVEEVLLGKTSCQVPASWAQVSFCTSR